MSRYKTFFPKALINIPTIHNQNNRTLSSAAQLSARCVSAGVACRKTTKTCRHIANVCANLHTAIGLDLLFGQRSRQRCTPYCFRCIAMPLIVVNSDGASCANTIVGRRKESKSGQARRTRGAELIGRRLE